MTKLRRSHRIQAKPHPPSQSPHQGNDQICPTGSYFLTPPLHWAWITGKKPQKLEEGTQAPPQTLVNMAFKVFNNREEEAKQLRDKNIPTKYQMLASVLQNQTPHRTYPKDQQEVS
jgi:hypothetical protein